MLHIAIQLNQSNRVNPRIEGKFLPELRNYRVILKNIVFTMTSNLLCLFLPIHHYCCSSFSTFGTSYEWRSDFVTTEAVNTHLSSLGTKDCFDTENLLDGSPSPSNRTSSPPMLLKWFCARVFSDIVDLRAYKVIKWSDKSVHCSFKFSLRMTLKSSAKSNFRYVR
jgi:hypothetical protein